jgi:hypothetical protein
MLNLVIVGVIVYYSDMALKLNLPPRSQFSKDNAPVLSRDLIKYARHMLTAEQLREKRGRGRRVVGEAANR